MSRVLDPKKASAYGQATATKPQLAQPGTRRRLALLGGFELVVDDAPGRLAFSAQRVLAFLALQPRPVQRPFVAGCLWPESSQERANANLRTALWRLGDAHGALADEPASHLALRPDVAVDFHDASARARRLIHHHARPWDDDLETLSESRELLPDWYDDWLEIERERFRQLRLSALERLCIELTADGRFPEAVQAGVAAVAADRLRESAHRVLIAAHLAAGNPGEALQQYQSCREVLARRLGWEPSLEMRLLVSALPFQASRLTR